MKDSGLFQTAEQRERAGIGAAPGNGSAGVIAWYALKVRPGREFAVWREFQELPDTEFLLPVFGAESRAALAAGRPPAPEDIRFPSYLLFEANLTPELRKKIEVVDGASYVLNRDKPCPIPPCEVNLVRHVMSLDRSPLLGEAPEKGRVAEIVEGPMEGISGFVTWRNGQKARIVTVPRFAGGRALEVVVPLNLIRIGEFDSGGKPHSPKGRGGRRVRRSRAWRDKHSQAA